MKNKSAFTLVELLVTVIIIGVLATMGIATYQGVIEKSKAKVCEQNVKMLTTAVKMYSLENDSLPATLSQIPGQYYRKAYAQVIEQGPKHMKLARKVINHHNHSSSAYANTPPLPTTSDHLNFSYFGMKNYGASAEAFVCPADTDGATSYAMNTQLFNKKWKDLPSGMTIVIDHDGGPSGARPSFNGGAAGATAQRHKRGFATSAATFGHIGTKSAVVKAVVAKGKTVPVVEGVPGSCDDGEGGSGGSFNSLCIDNLY